MIHGREVTTLLFVLGVLAPTMALMAPVYAEWISGEHALAAVAVVFFIVGAVLLATKRAVYVTWGEVYYVPFWKWKRYEFQIELYKRRRLKCAEANERARWGG